jgi:hypothetical protein
MTVATVAVQQFTGAGPTKDTVTTPRLSTMDDDAPGTSNPIPIAESGLSLSYWMTLHLTITNMQDATLLNNHEFYSDGGTGAWTLGTDGLVQVAQKTGDDMGVPVASYDQASGEEGVSGDDFDDVTDGHAYYKTGVGTHAAPADLSDLLTGARMTVDIGDHTEAEGFKGIVLQAIVDDDATRGAQAVATLTFVYDEV